MTIVLNGTTGITNDGGYTGDGVVFADTTPANTLVTTTGGNVGIGTSSPSDSQSFGKAFDLRGTTGSAYYSGTTDATTRAYFATYTGGAYLGTETNHPQIFRTNNTERARIDSSGNLLVGTTSSAGRLTVYADSGVGQQIQVFQIAPTVLQFRNAQNLGGSITIASGGSTAYNTSSDYRLKENIQPMTGALSLVSALKPCTYNWKSDGSDGQGFIAHELQAVVPDAVVGEKDAVDTEGKPVYQGIDTSFLVATLTAAIQEQQAIITALTARVAALEGK